VIASLAAAAVLLAAFAVIETRSSQALLPVRLLRDRNRTGAYLSYAGVGIFIFGRVCCVGWATPRVRRLIG
jgi:hypothetical protein